MRYQRTIGLMLSQMQELVWRVQDRLAAPWIQKIGRPKSCGLYRAAEIACMYIRHNATQEFLEAYSIPQVIEKKNRLRAAS